MVHDLARVDLALLPKPTLRTKFFELVQSTYFSVEGMDTKTIDELNYMAWVVNRNIAVRRWTIVNPRVTYFRAVHGEFFTRLKVHAIEELIVNGKDEISTLVKRICKEAGRLRSLQLSNLLWLTYPKLRHLLQDASSTLRVFHLDTVKHISSAYFLRLVPNLLHLQELMLGRLELNAPLLGALSQHCRKLHTVEFSSCPVHCAALLDFIRSYTVPLPHSPRRSLASSSHQYSINNNNNRMGSASVSVQTINQLRSIVLTYNTNVQLSAIAMTIGEHCGSALVTLCLVGDYEEASALNGYTLIQAATRLPLLQHIDVSKNNYLGDLAIHSLVSYCLQLRVLCLHSCRQLTDFAVAGIAQHCAHLQDLDLSWCDNITNTALQLLRMGNAGLLSSLCLLKINSCYRITSKQDLLELVSRCTLLTMDKVSTKFTRLE